MNDRFNRITVKLATAVLGVLAGSALVACASADPDAAVSRTTAGVSDCGGTINGTYSTLGNHYTYDPQPLNVGCAAPGASVSVFLAANDVPNKFTILDASNNSVAVSGWLGNATYSGPWGATLSNSGTASLSFNNSNGPYFIRVETLTPPDGSYPQTTDVWSASASCQCAAPALHHYTCGYAMDRPGYNCDSGRNHLDITAVDMSQAIQICEGSRISGYPDFCYVIARDGAASSEINECTAAQASWRGGNDCCNFKGANSCPF